MVTDAADFFNNFPGFLFKIMLKAFFCYRQKGFKGLDFYYHKIFNEIL